MTTLCGDDRGIGVVPCRIQVDAKEAKSLTDTAADDRRIFADSPSEHQRVQTTQRGSEGTNPLLRFIAKQRECFSGTYVAGLPCQQVPYVRAGFRHAEQPSVGGHHVVELLGVHALAPAE